MGDTAAANGLRRSMLFVPVNNARALDKAQSLPADAIIVDLEDAVADHEKADMRTVVGERIAARDFGHREVWIRINAVDTQDGHDDLRAVASLPVTGLVLPKVEDPELVHRTGVLLGDSKSMIVMIETPRGVLAAAETLSAHRHVAAAMLGLQDLGAALDLDLQATPGDRSALAHALQHTVLAAAAAGADAIDSVVAEFRNLDPVIAECSEARALGFRGKAAIHPAQLAPINAAFCVSAAQVEHAREVVECFDRAVADGNSVANLNGSMIEALHADAARSTLARAEAEASRDNTS